MDGLEISEIYLSKIRERSTTYRLDSHYYEKKYILLNHKLLSKSHWLLGDIVLKPIQTGHTPSMSISSNYGGEIAFIKTDNLRANYIATNFSDYLSNEGNREILRTELQEKDILTTIIGATEDVIARTALVLQEHLPANINQNIVQIRINDSIALPEYINIYLNSTYGRDYLRYLSRQTEQVNLNCQEVSSVVVPKVTIGFQDNIRKCVSKAYQLQQEANREVEYADVLLKKNINIENKNLSSITSILLTNSLKETGRLDAEYYQPIYENIENQIDCTNTIITSCEIRDENFTPKENELYQYIELANVDSMGGISTVDKIHGKELPSRARRLVKTGQVIISSVEGSLQSCALITEEFNNALCSTGFYVLDSEKYNSETLLVLFKSEAIQALLKKRCSGTILTAISKEEFEKMPLPEVDGITQNAIKEKVQESFRLRRKSKELLDIAIKAVEMAIETDEQTALSWLDAQNV